MRETIKSRRDRNSPTRTAIANLVRVAAVRAADAVTRWQLSGQTDDQGNEEVFDDVEVYQQVGFASRPKSGSKTSGIIASLAGSARAAVLVATRSALGRPAVDEDETAIHNSLRALLIDKLGQVLIGENAVDAIIKGTAYRTAEISMHNTISSASTALTAALATFAASAAGPADIKVVVAAIGSFLGFMVVAQQVFEASAATYLSTISKTE